jgi:hypothetical protein
VSNQKEHRFPASLSAPQEESERVAEDRGRKVVHPGGCWEDPTDKAKANSRGGMGSTEMGSLGKNGLSATQYGVRSGCIHNTLMRRRSAALAFKTIDNP